MTGGARPRRILLVTSSYPTPEAPLAAPWNAWEMEALRERGVEVRVFRPVVWMPRLLAPFSARIRRKIAAPREYEWNGVTVESPRILFSFQTARLQATRFPRTFLRGLRLSALGALRRAVERHRPDGIIVQAGFPWGRAMAALRRRTGVPYVFVEHSMWDFAKMTPGDALHRGYLAGAESANGVAVVGPQMVPLIRDTLGVPRVRFVPNGAWPPTPEMLAAPRPEPLRDRFVICCVTNYIRKKGIEELVEAFERAAATRPEALLVIATAAPSELRERIAASPVRAQIDLRPPLPNPEVRQLMAWSNLFAMISWEEAFGIVYTEALMAGCPVLMSQDCGAAGMMPVAAPGEASERHVGLVVPPRDVAATAAALTTALRSPELLAAMGRHGAEWANANLSWRRHVEALLDMLAEASR